VLSQLSTFHPHVVDEGNSFQTWKVPVNILNVQLQTVNKELSSNMEVGQGVASQSITFPDKWSYHQLLKKVCISYIAYV
jgi:hypothetical protein